jgi:hypothetical protein
MESLLNDKDAQRNMNGSLE